MLSFRIKNANLDVSNKFLSNLKIFALAESLGGIESLAELPVVMTHASVDPALRLGNYSLTLELGITESLIRISIGIEDVNDLKKDLNDSLIASSN
jgi:cystathionine beta-lyase/cystathionine gamma-synthase